MVIFLIYTKNKISDQYWFDAKIESVEIIKQTYLLYGKNFFKPAPDRGKKRFIFLQVMDFVN